MSAVGKAAGIGEGAELGAQRSLTGTCVMGEPIRQTTIKAVTSVRHVMSPDHHNPPDLGQLRKFVNACEGLDDDVTVRIEKGDLSESGRFSYTFSVRIETEAGGME